MDEIDRKQLYNSAWKHWGADAQVDMLIEEMGELTVALLHARRNGVIFSYDVSEEVGDVEICLEQFKTRMQATPTTTKKDGEIIKSGCIYDVVEQFRNTKLLRLKDRLMESLSKKYPEVGESLGNGR
jgi:hypothetical protein